MYTRASRRTQPERMATSEAGRSHEIVVIPQQERSIRRFSGQAGYQELDLFLEEVESVWAQRPNQSDTERAAFLWAHLGGDAKAELACQGVSRQDKAAVVDGLREAYGDRRPISSLSVAFYNARQEGYEGVRQFTTRLHAAFVELNRQRKRHNIAELEEACLRIQFIEGLADDYLKLSLRQHSLSNPNANFYDLRRVVLSWKPEDSDVITTGNPPPPEDTSLREQTEQIQEALKFQAETVKSLAQSVEEICKKRTFKEAVEGKRRGVRPRKNRCYQCGMVGHHAASCRKNQLQWHQQNHKSAEVNNQEVTIKQLKENSKENEERVEPTAQTRVKQKGRELQQVLAEKERQLQEAQLTAEKKLGEAEQKIASLHSDLQSAQSELIEEKSKYDEATSTMSDELEIIMADLERANERAAQAERQTERLKLQLSMDAQGMEAGTSDRTDGTAISTSATDMEGELTAKEREIDQLVEDVQGPQASLTKLRELTSAQVARLEEELSNKNQAIAVLEENSHLKVLNTSLAEEVSKLQEDYHEAVTTLQEQRSLITQLEEDALSSMFRGDAEGEPGPPDANTEAMANIMKEVGPISTTQAPSDPGSKLGEDFLLLIVRSEGEQDKLKAQEPETQTLSQQQNCSAKGGPTGEVTRNYFSQYEERLDPFTSLSRKERQRSNLEPKLDDLITLSLSRLIMGNRTVRAFAVSFTLVLHFLVFLVLYKVAHTESWKRDMMADWHERYAKHMMIVHEVSGEKWHAATSEVRRLVRSSPDMGTVGSPQEKELVVLLLSRVNMLPDWLTERQGLHTHSTRLHGPL